MELKTKSTFRVADYLTKDCPCWQLAQGSVGHHDLKSLQTLFLHLAVSLQPFFHLPNFLQKSIYSRSFYFTFHSFAFQLPDWKKILSFAQLVIGDFAAMKFATKVFSSTRSQYSFSLYMNDRNTSSGRYKTTL